MKEIKIISALVVGFLFLISIQLSSQPYALPDLNQSFAKGEELTYKLYYNSMFTGNVTAGIVVSKVQHKTQNIFGRNLTHIVLDGETKGAFRLFFKAKDRFETFIDPSNHLPYYFKKRIQEGGYKASRDVKFDQEIGNITSINNKSKSTKEYKTDKKVQDLLSSLYYIRNFNFDNVKLNQRFSINLFMDDSVYQIQFEFTGYETIKTSLGKFSCLKLVPHVLTGSVFAEETPMIVYVSNDKNHVPILAESELMIGRARMELIDHKGLKWELKEEIKKK